MVIKDVIAQYECILGAKLNLDKSTLIQLDSPTLLEWFSQAGCQIARSGEIISYLGISIGGNVMDVEELEFVLDKVRNQVKH